ncbi:MAG: beta-1,3-glucanase family protein [Solirubrobacterales bacterium]
MSRSRSILLLTVTLAFVLAAPSAASALSFAIDNESGRPADDVYVTIAGSDFDVPGMANNVPRRLSEVPNPLTINTIEAGRVYVSYGAPVTEGEPFSSPTRFDWAELTVKPSADDVANLTAVDQFAIGMRLDTFGAGGAPLETVSATNSNTLFDALQQIPGGPQATIRNPSGEIVRVLSPLHATSYPDLGEYVRSMAGQTITLRTGLFFKPFATSFYSGTFASDGSIELTGVTNPLGMASSPISFTGAELIEDIYTGANTPNNGEGAIRRDLLAGFSAGFWGGKYGNDAIAFCSNPTTTAQGSWCPNGFNQPAYAAARTAPAPFPSYEPYAAVIAQYADEYGNPYSDASGRVTVGLDQPVDGGPVETLRLTILPDSPTAPTAPSSSPPSGGGSGQASGGATPTPVQAQPSVSFRVAKALRLRGGKLRAGKLVCATACGKVRAVARRGHAVIGRVSKRVRSPRAVLLLRLTPLGKRVLARRGQLKLRLDVWATPPGGRTAHASSLLTRSASRR